MRLKDINETMFMQLDPETQRIIIETQQVDPFTAGIFAFVVVAFMYLLFTH